MSALTVLIALSFAVAGPVPAAAGDIVDDGAPGILTLDVSPAPFDVELAPGERAFLTVTTWLDTPDDGDLRLWVSGSGALGTHPAGLRLELRECTTLWAVPADPVDDPGCAGTPTVTVPDAPLAAMSSSAQDLGTLPAGGARHFLAIISFTDPAPAELQGARGGFVLGFVAAGDTEVAGPPSHPITGVAVGIALAVAAGLAGAGTLLVLVPRRRRLARRAGVS